MSKEATYDAKTRAYFEDLGFTIHKVQTYNRFAGKAKDMFGFIDFVGMSDTETIGIQSTSWGCRKKHIDEYKEPYPKAMIEKWSKCRGRKAVLICWKKVKKVRGGKAFKYEPVVEDLMELI